MGTPAEHIELEDQEERAPRAMTEAEERAAFEQAIDEDPDLSHEAGARPPAPELEAKEEEDDEEPEAPAAESEEQPPEAQEQKPESKVPTGLEWLDELPEEKRAQAQEFIERQGQAIARLDQRVASHLGQLRPAQRALSQMQRKLRELQQEQTQQKGSVPESVAKRRADMHKRIDEEYADFPEEATKLKALFDESLDGIVSGIPQHRPPPDPTLRGPDRSEEQQHLQTAYSDWGERRYSPEFEQWLANQPNETKQLLNSPFAADNIALLDSFTRDNPDWQPPQTPEDFHSLYQAVHSPLFRGWAEGEGINPDMNPSKMPDHQRDMILSRFKADFSGVLAELQETDTKGTKLRQRRQQQLQNRDPGSRRMGIKPGQKIDLDTEEGQRAYFDQLVSSDPDIR